MGLTEELYIFDTKINRLKVNYEQYFARVLKREPVALRKELDSYVLKYSNQQITNTELKFKYSTLVAKYISYKQLWDKILRQIEEGTYIRNKSLKADSTEDIFGKDIKYKIIYQQFIEAKKKTNEPLTNISYDKFIQTIIQQTERAKKELKCKDVDFKVVVKDGKTKISLIPIKE